MFLVVKIQFWWDCLLTTGGREESLFTSILQKGLGEIVIYIWTFCRSGPEESQCSRSSLLCIFSFDVFVPSVSVIHLKIDLIFPEHHSFFLFGKLFCATVFRVLHSFALRVRKYFFPRSKYPLGFQLCFSSKGELWSNYLRSELCSSTGREERAGKGATLCVNHQPCSFVLLSAESVVHA